MVVSFPAPTVLDDVRDNPVLDYPSAVIAIRLLIGVVVAAIVGVALIPLFVLLDLRSGGTGWGLCADGFGRCSTSYFSGFELVAGLLAVMMGLVLLIGVLVRLLRYLRQRKAARGLPA